MVVVVNIFHVVALIIARVFSSARCVFRACNHVICIRVKIITYCKGIDKVVKTKHVFLLKVVWFSVCKRMTVV